MNKTVLILGANGRFGRHAAEAFWNAGWSVRTHDRASGDLIADAQGAAVIVNGWNPAYPDWKTDLPGLTARVIDAAKASGATVLIPGNVYVFGKDAPERFAEDTPHAATNPLGRLRIEMEAAYRASGVQTIVLRGGDFLDTQASGNWFDGVLAAKAGKGRFVWPGDPGVAHAWAYLPDFARAMVMLADRRAKLGQFTDVPFPGYTLSGDEVIQHAATALNRPMKRTGFPWPAIWAARPFWRMARGLWEMRYLWSKPHHLDGALFARLLPEFRPTPVAEAMASALQVQIDPNQPVTAGGNAIAAE